MVLHMSRPFKHPTTGVYYFRKGVPDRLRHLVGKREVKISLGTKDPAEAKRLNAIVTGEVEAEWARLVERAERPKDKLTREQIVSLSGELYRALIAQHGADPGEPGHWARRLADIQRALPEHLRTSRLSTTFYQGWFFEIGTQSQYKVGQDVDRLLEREGLAVDWDTRIKLCMAGATAVAQAYRELEKRANDDYRPDPDGQRFPDWKALVRAEPLDWKEVYEKYVKRNDPAASTIKRQKGVIEKFFAFVEHDDMNRVTDVDVERWIEHRLTEVKPRTVRDADLAHPKTLFLFAKSAKLIRHAPFAEAKVMVKDEPELREREFTLDEAERILAASLVAPGKRMTVEGGAARRWVPWLCAYSGARVNEITQARASDVAQHKSKNGQLIWCINVTPEAGSVKTRKARVVPLHPHIIEQGFLDYVASRNGRHLFYDPGRARNGAAANPQYKKAGERLARWVRKTVGITDVGVDPNHGWRHLFRSTMLFAEVQEQVINRVDGHAGKTEGQKYGTAWPEVALAAISKIPPYRLGGLA
nr:DUF6538 domain-containing protein [uncultured Devosia sp.]